LGVTLDRRLHFGNHIKERRRKALQVFSALKTLLLADLTPSIKDRIYLSILRPTILYGHELYHSGINIDYIERFDRYWLRVSQRRWKEDRRTLYADSKFPPISQYIKDNQKRYIKLK